ncbi:MAG: DUF3461 family protein [Woeseiaceae bacterium]
MKSYPCLTEMGVMNPLQISSYAVNSVDFVDVLRLTYDRPKDSKLPGSKTFRFPRVQKELPAGKVADTAAVVMESGPALKCVVKELEHLTKLKSENKDITAVMLEELRLLEEDIALRSEYLKALIGKINKI